MVKTERCRRSDKNDEHGRKGHPATACSLRAHVIAVQRAGGNSRWPLVGVVFWEPMKE